MKTTKKHFTLKFYQNLGILFYAIAAADNDVQSAEFDKLKTILKEQWLAIDTIEDAYHSDAAFQIEIVFDWLNAEDNLNTKGCFETFVDFKNEHKHLFTPEVKQLILKTAGAIAASFSGKNKSELMMLAQLDMELKKT